MNFQTIVNSIFVDRKIGHKKKEENRNFLSWFVIFIKKKTDRQTEHSTNEMMWMEFYGISLKSFYLYEGKKNEKYCISSELNLTMIFNSRNHYEYRMKETDKKPVNVW